MSDVNLPSMSGESFGGDNPAPGSFESLIDTSATLASLAAELSGDGTDGEDAQLPELDAQTTDSANAQGQQTQEQQPSEPKFDPMAFALHTQEQFTQLASQLPQMVAQAVAQAMQGVLPKQPEPPPPPNPLDALDPNDPDYHIKRYDLQLQQLADQNRRLQERLDAQENGVKQQQQQAQQQAQQQQFVGYVNTELNKAVGSLFQGWPDTPQIKALKEAAANKIDKAWYDSGWQPHGYNEGFKQARELVNQFSAFKNTPPPAAQARPPVQSSRAAATTPGAQTVKSDRDFWSQLDATLDQDARVLRAIQRGGQ